MYHLNTVTRLFKLAICIFFASSVSAQGELAKGEHFADINGVKLHYYVAGSGPVCLFPTPGWGPSVEGYMKSLQPMENYFTMVWYDTRSTGKSTIPTDLKKHTSKDFLADMDGLRTHLRQEKVWVAGHSMGGFQVLNYGIHHTNNLNGIIAISAMAGADSLYQSEFTKMVMKRKGQPYFEKGSDIFFGRDKTKYKTTELMQFIFPFYFHDVSKMAEFAKMDDSKINDQADEYTTAAGFGREYLFPLLKKIDVPTLVVVGDDDFICDKVSQSDRVVKNISSSTEVVVKDAGHFCWIEQPKQFFADLEKWLQLQQLKPSK